MFKCGELLNNEVGGASRNGYSCQRMCNRYSILGHVYRSIDSQGDSFLF